MAEHKPILGLAGGIGSGKSTVAAVFARQGCLVIDSDALNHEILARPAVAQRLREWWGPQVVGPDGGTDRAAVGRIVFQEPTQRERLESFVHPLIAERRAAMIQGGNSDPAVKAITLDSPLLFESNLDRECDATVFVDVPEDVRLNRLQQTRNWDSRQLLDRERWQLPLDEKRRRSDFVVDNKGSIEELQPQVVAILRRMLA